MEVDFMVSDSLEVRPVALCVTMDNSSHKKAVRPKLTMPKSIEEAAKAVADIFNVARQNAGREYAHFTLNILLRPRRVTMESESGEDSDGDDVNERPQEDEDDDEDGTGPESAVSIAICM